MSTSITSIDHVSSKSTETSSSCSPSQNDKFKESPDTTSTHDFADLVFLKKISKAKFAVYLVESSSKRKQYALKAFPFHNNRQSARYEKRSPFLQAYLTQI